MTTGIVKLLFAFMPNFFISSLFCFILHSCYFYFFVGSSVWSIVGMADLILVNSKFTASTFAKTFKQLNSRGVRPAVLYPAVNVDQFDKPSASK